MHIPWLQVRQMIYYMAVHLIFNEADNGPVVTPVALIPASAAEVVPQLKETEHGQQVLERLESIRRQVFGLEHETQSK
jgi:hypothetical protein